MNLPVTLIDQIVRAGLAEDLEPMGDITSAAIFAETHKSGAMIIARESGILAGMALAQRVFAMLDPQVEFKTCLEDGAALSLGMTFSELRGSTIKLLSGERLALNFLARLSGIATLTREYVNACDGTKAKIACTRKTTPGLRALEKYAVMVGGGKSHRFNLSDGVLIKDNHIAGAGSLSEALKAAQKHSGHMVKIAIEVDSLEQLEEALACGPDVVLLDNMEVAQMREAVRLANGKAIVEASGGIDLSTVRSIAETGVDVISVGKLTHSARALDMSMELVK